MRAITALKLTALLVLLAWMPAAAGTKGAVEQQKDTQTVVTTQTTEGYTAYAYNNLSSENQYKEKKTAFYFAPKYQLPVGTTVPWGGVNVEIGWVWRSGWLFGIDGNFGYWDNRGDEYISYGTRYWASGTLGWLIGVGLSLGKEYDLGNQMQIVVGGSAGLWSKVDYVYSFYYDCRQSGNVLAPFVKWRWRSFEIMYRGFLGGYSHSFRDDDYYKDEDGFGFTGHQIMIGYCFGGRKPR